MCATYFDRAYIINILPNLWMLNGQLITGERTCDVKVIETTTPVFR